jgi:hypothetical protein
MSDKPAILTELERVYELLNEKLFDGKLSPVNIVIGRGADYPKKKVTLRYFNESKSLVVGADFPGLEYGDLPLALLHEMIHIRNAQAEVVDCTTNHYHNKAFLTAALAVGLVVIKHKTQGWSLTTTMYPRNVVQKKYIMKPTRDAATRLGEVFALIKFDKTIFKQAKSEIRQQAKEDKPSKTYFLKYVCNCPPPHNSIRSGRRPDGPNALNIQCQNCHSTFVCVTELDPDDEQE